VAILSFAGDRSDRGFVMRGVLFGLLAVCVSGCVTIEDVARRDTRVGIAAMAGRFGEALQEKGRAAAVF
jgi:hypothetical protein